MSSLNVDPRKLKTANEQVLGSTNWVYTETFAKFILPRRVKEPTKQEGPFCKVYVLDEEIFLLGGVVTGGSGNITVPDISLSPSAPESLPEDGTHHWLSVSYTAYREDDVLLAGGYVTAVTEESGTILPDNTIPTFNTPNGTLYISLGSWALNKFVPSGCGNFLISHCPASLTYTRAGGSTPDPYLPYY